MSSIIDKIKQKRAASKQLQIYFRDTLLLIVFSLVFSVACVLYSLLDSMPVIFYVVSMGHIMDGSLAFILLSCWNIYVIKKHFAKNHANEYIEMQQKITEAFSICWKYLLVFVVGVAFVLIGLDGCNLQTVESVNNSAVVLILLGAININGGMVYWVKKCYPLYGVWVEIKANKALAEEIV